MARHDPQGRMSVYYINQSGVNTKEENILLSV